MSNPMIETAMRAKFDRALADYTPQIEALPEGAP